MLKSDLVKVVSELSGVAKNDVVKVINFLPEVIIDTVKSDVNESVNLGPFKFCSKVVPERVYSAKTITLRGEQMEIPEKKVDRHNQVVVKVKKAVKKF